MTIRQIMKILDAQLISGENFLDKEVLYCLRRRHDE
jgi:hypothetical protein